MNCSSFNPPKKIKAMKTKMSASEQLERNRSVLLKTGFIISLSLVLLAFEYQTVESTINLNSGILISENLTEELPPIVPDKEEAPKPKININDLNVVKDDTKITTEVDITAEITAIPDPVDPLPETPYIEPRTDEIDFVLDAEKRACFPGGDGAMFSFIGANIRYPRQALENNIMGTVYITFIVEKNGSISNTVISRGIGGGCEDEAMRIIGIMPLWEPAMQGNKPVRMKLTIPFRFLLK
jgi:periplasmic protein TonB